MSPLLATAAALTGGGHTAPSSVLFANAQRPGETIAACAAEPNSTCAAEQNRTCYRYEESGAHECGPCLDGFLEFGDECYGIDGIDAERERWPLLSALLRRYLPEYADGGVSDEVRARRLVVAARVISYWNSRVPPPEFKLGLTNETLLTEDELRGRLGIASSLAYDLGDTGKRGAFGRFDFGGDGKARGLVGPEAEGGRRKLQAAVDWAAEGYTTRVKNQGLCGCCWAVATAGAVESALMITNQTSRYDSLDRNSLSFQQMISCDDEEKGCQGGNIVSEMCSALTIVPANKYSYLITATDE